MDIKDTPEEKALDALVENVLRETGNDTNTERRGDAGTKAREKVNTRKPSMRKRMYKSLLVVLVFIPVLCFSAGLFIYKQWAERELSGYHYKRSCELPVDVGMDVKGTRKYTNQASSFMGMRIVDANKAEERTRIEASMLETTITGINGTEWWTIHNTAAEPRVMDLKPAETYIFTQGSKTFVIKYEDFCR